MTPTIHFAPQALDVIRRAAAESKPRDHADAIGGILIGKRVDDRIVILAATEPGPNAHDQRMGFGLDFEHANTALQNWFDRDPEADIVGVWHTHPSGLVALTDEDTAAAYTLRDDSGREAVSVIAIDWPEGAAVTCFYLDATASQPAALVPVRYTEGGDDVRAVPVPKVYDVDTEPESAAIDITDEADTSPAPVGAVVLPTPTDADATTLRSEPTTAEAVEHPAPYGSPTPTASVRSRAFAIGFGVILILLVFALFRACAGGASENLGAVPVASATAALNVAAAEPSATTAPIAEEPTATAPPPVEEPTATELPTAEPIEPPTAEPTATEAVAPTATPEAAPTDTAETAVATDAAATTAASAVAETTATAATTATPAGSPLPYVIVFEPMTNAQRTAFLARARAADCADCYNVDLIGPDPYEQILIKVDQKRPVLRNYDVPTLIFVEPSAEPQTLQVVDPQGEAVSPPITVDVAPDSYYTLRIETP